VVLSAVVRSFDNSDEAICSALLAFDDVLESDGGHGRKEWVDVRTLVGPVRTTYATARVGRIGVGCMEWANKGKK
jgi:hypothetical protein